MSKAKDYAYGILTKRRLEAEFLAESTLDYLLSFSDYSQCYRQIREQILVVARCPLAEKQQQQKQLDTLREQIEQIALRHNRKQQQTEPNYSCSLCSDGGFYNGKQCKCVTKLIREYLVAESNVDQSKTFASSVPHSDSTKEVFDFFEVWCKKLKTTVYKNAFICGQTGVGKSYLANAIANSLLSQNYSLLLLASADLNRKFLQYHLSELSQKEELWNAFADVDVLIIDDLGAENHYKNVTENYLFDLLNQRKRRHLTTVILSNLYPENIIDTYGERIFSRIVDKNDTVSKLIISPDRRVGKK